MNILFYCQGDDGQVLQSFRQRLPQHRFIDWNSERPLAEPELITAAIVWMPPEDFFDQLVGLKQIHAFSAGVDHLLQHPGLPEDVTIIRLQDAGMAQQMAEYALYGTLHSQRQMGQLRKSQRRRHWQREVKASATAVTQVGILGAGALGLHVASRLSLNGYPVHCWSRSARQSPDDRIRMFHGQDALSEFLAGCQVLVCLLPLTDATRGILNQQLFEGLPQGAFLINPGRGNHLVENDLLSALETGQLSGALLDVFSTEPLPENHPFWDHPDILITPHVAAQSLEDESVNQIVDDIEAIDRGDAPSCVVCRQSGY
ncbi:2-hydroxyacid dehydrogenase [Granulosicoccus sp. 3-233]|uniref:2-hydroxyacid dehydrogenase n=1 Tax=Granulosicoccus sp. 3-233 TaxID=3417969 RepID=UPI003D3349C8